LLCERTSLLSQKKVMQGHKMVTPVVAAQIINRAMTAPSNSPLELLAALDCSTIDVFSH
jgi:hypothetical protein